MPDASLVTTVEALPHSAWPSVVGGPGAGRGPRGPVWPYGEGGASGASLGFPNTARLGGDISATYVDVANGHWSPALCIRKRIQEPALDVPGAPASRPNHTLEHPKMACRQLPPSSITKEASFCVLPRRSGPTS